MRNQQYEIWLSNHIIRPLQIRIIFGVTFFPYCINEMDTLIYLEVQFFHLLRWKETRFASHGIVGVKLFTRLRLSFSHLIDHRFIHNFNKLSLLL